MASRRAFIFFDLVSMASGIAAICLKERRINLCQEMATTVLGQLVKMAYAVVTTHIL